MVITGSAILVEPGTHEKVVESLARYPEVTFHVKSDSGTELVVNLEAEDFDALEQLCSRLREEISDIVEVAHIYVNFEDEVEKIRSGKIDKTRLSKPEIFDER
jgi:nitrate reductase NapAB chaperone NapD